MNHGIRFNTLFIIVYLGESEVSPDNNHVGIPLQQSVPDLQMLDLLEVLLWFVVLVEESSEVRSQELLPPAIVLGSQLQLILKHWTLV